MLGLGNGLGTDWAQYASHGARVVVCCPSRDQLALIRRNFELRGLSGRFLHSSMSALPLESATIDVACLSDLGPELDDPKPAIAEIYRVLKPGGKVLAVMPARFNIGFWVGIGIPWQRWFTTRGCLEPVPSQRFSRRNLRQLFSRFVEARVHKRHLRRSEVPHLWRWIPMSLLERSMGNVLLYKAFKPLSAAKTIQEAA
jgi:SAM-dependent methyltransferase